MTKKVSGTFPSDLDKKFHIFYGHESINAERETCIHVILQHGLLEYHERHREFIDFLLDTFKEQGVVVSYMDFIGHGQSGGNRVYIEDFKNLDNDFEYFVKRVKGEFKPKRLFLVGHSLGGLVVLKRAIELNRLNDKINGIILINPCLGVSAQVGKEVRKRLQKIPRWMGKIRVPVYNARELTHDKAKVKAFVSDHLISKFVTIRMVLEILDEVENISFSSYFLKLPCLFVLSGKDKIVDNNKAELYIKSMEKSFVQVERFPTKFHDILNETGRAKVFDLIASYIEKKV